MVTLGLAFAAIVLRVMASAARSFGLRCRRASLRAFACGTDVQTKSRLDLEETAPSFALRIASILPAQDLEQYYEPTRPIGDERLCELYAHCAYYTRRLLRQNAWVCGITSAAVFAGGMLALYSLAMQQVTPTTVRESVIATICSFVFVLIFARLLQLTISCVNTSITLRKLEDDFFDKPTTKRLTELVEGYEIERATGPDVPTPLYYIWRNSLKTSWNERRTAL